MNKSILSVLIANAIYAPYALADIYSTDSQSAEQDYFSALIDGTGGHVGAFFEKEDKKVYNEDGSLNGTNEYIENSLITGFLYQKDLPFSLNYSFKQIQNTWRNAEGTFTQKDDGFQLSTNLAYRHGFGNGLSTGLGWKTEIERSTRYQSNLKGDLDKDQHQFYTFLGYWNNDWRGGFYSELSYGLQDDTNELDSGDWGRKDTTYYKVMLKPYKNFGNFFVGVELYYEDKDTESKRSGQHLENFKEFYVEPEIAYQFDFGGRLFVKQRYTEKTTTQANGNEYFGTVNKTTIGYQHNIKDWMVGAEVELFNEDKEQDVGAGKVGSGNEEYNKLKLMAQYRF
ncbi:cymA protein precursor [Vibrio ishigakensis]|uniref:CymA protein n=1 Tax=Vibrio ishigakensis TaxID=1481914 RepID=A0A0B8PCL2_9VIBR|nr:cymA protein precursor [Vibrio ishigakensis]